MRKQNYLWKRQWIALATLAGMSACGGWVSSAMAKIPQPPECVVPSDGGGEVPSPFTDLNQRVELADGEYYTLVGTVVTGSGNHPERYSHAISLSSETMGSQPNLKVDLAQHPWLANQLRRDHPLYPLQEGWGVWSRYLQRRVRLTVRAKGMIVLNPIRGELDHVIGLTLVEGTSVEVMTQQH